MLMLVDKVQVWAFDVALQLHVSQKLKFCFWSFWNACIWDRPSWFSAEFAFCKFVFFTMEEYTFMGRSLFCLQKIVVLLFFLAKMWLPVGGQNKKPGFVCWILCMEGYGTLSTYLYLQNTILARFPSYVIGYLQWNTTSK